ncbi:MAG: hypothetical protein R3F54_29210 [Alphaproteobacteria bacterium]
MFSPAKPLQWQDLIGPLSEAMLALGQLRHALQDSPLHPAWLWRETARTSAKIAQNAGYRVTFDQLVRDLAGLPLDRSDDHGGVAAGRRIFLTAGRLFRAPDTADSIPAPTELFQPILGLDPRIDGEEPGRGGSSAADPDADLAALRDVVRAMVTAAQQAPTPLIGLLEGMRSHRTRRLSRTLARLALPLALDQAGLVPTSRRRCRRRLPLGADGTSGVSQPGQPVVGAALAALAREADGACQRLDDLTRQHRARHAFTGRASSGLLAPRVGSAGGRPWSGNRLAARHLGCMPQGAGCVPGVGRLGS